MICSIFLNRKFTFLYVSLLLSIHFFRIIRYSPQAQGTGDLTSSDRVGDSPRTCHSSYTYILLLSVLMTGFQDALECWQIIRIQVSHPSCNDCFSSSPHIYPRSFSLCYTYRWPRHLRTFYPLVILDYMYL